MSAVSSSDAPLIEAPDLPDWDHVVSGKVRELYVPAGADPATAEEVLVLATDRISAYDHSLQPGIPDKGRLLTGISLFWFEQLADLVPHHVLSASDVPEQVAGRAVVEASGTIRLETVRAVAETGVDVISVGALTHSAPALDLGLDVVVA